MSEKSLKTIVLDSVEYQAEAEVLKALHISKTDGEDNKKRLDNAEKEVSKLEGERDGLRVKLDSLEKEVKELKENTVNDEAIEKAIQERIGVLSIAEKYGVEVQKGDTDLEIKKKVILFITPDAQEKLDSADEVYVNARFDASVSLFSKEENNVSGAALGANRNDSVEDLSMKRKDYIYKLSRGEEV